MGFKPLTLTALNGVVVVTIAMFIVASVTLGAEIVVSKRANLGQQQLAATVGVEGARRSAHEMASANAPFECAFNAVTMHPTSIEDAHNMLLQHIHTFMNDWNVAQYEIQVDKNRACHYQMQL
jgi:hypothetical protein